MSVYLVHCPSLGLCKVGYAVSVARRLLVIKTFVPAPVTLIAERDGAVVAARAAMEKLQEAIGGPAR